MSKARFLGLYGFIFTFILQLLTGIKIGIAHTLFSTQRLFFTIVVCLDNVGNYSFPHALTDQKHSGAGEMRIIIIIILLRLHPSESAVVTDDGARNVQGDPVSRGSFEYFV